MPNDNFRDAEVICAPILIQEDYYNLTIGMQWVGKFERSELRYIIEQIDNVI